MRGICKGYLFAVSEGLERLPGKPDSGISLGCHAGDISVGCWTPGYTGNIGNIFVRCLVLVMLMAADYILS